MAGRACRRTQATGVSRLNGHMETPSSSPPPQKTISRGLYLDAQGWVQHEGLLQQANFLIKLQKQPPSQSLISKRTDKLKFDAAICTLLACDCRITSQLPGKTANKTSGSEPDKQAH